MAGEYRKRPVRGEKIVTQCNNRPACKAATQIGRLLTSAVYNWVVQWIPVRSILFNHSRKEKIMNQIYKLAAGLAAALGLGIAVTAANAHPGWMGAGMGPNAQGGMQYGAMAGMQQGARGQGMTGGPRHGVMGGVAGQGAGPALMTQEERSAMIEKLHNAATPEERQKIIAENRAEMEKRAREKGITLPEHRGPHAGFGPRSGTRPQAPATN
jgi:hypothetical protein